MGRVSTKVPVLSGAGILYAIVATILGGTAVPAQAKNDPRPVPRLPVANAGPDVSASAGLPVTLDGSASHPASSRPDNFIAFQWTVALAPAGSAATLDASSPAPVFTPDKPGTYSVFLVVTDSAGVRSAPDNMTVTAYDGNAPPNVRLGRKLAGLVGSPVALDASGSFDPEGAATTYLWWLVSAPAASRLTSSNIAFADSANPSFVPDVEGAYVFGAQVSDGETNTELAVTVTAFRRDVPPFADAGADQRIRPGEVAHLNGQGNGTLSWSLVSRPAGSSLTSAAIRDGGRGEAQVTPDAPGTYLFRLEATDGRRTDGDNVLVLVKPNDKPRAAPDTAATSVFTPVDVNVLANDSDPDGDPLTILAVGQGSMGSTEIHGGAVRYRPIAGAIGTDLFQYTIGDGHGGTDTSTVTVTISTLGQPLIESFTPASGFVGDAVTLTGANLTAASAVKFGGVAAAFTVLSSTEIRTSVPDGAGSAPISVFSPGGVFTTAKSFSVTAASDFGVAVVPGTLQLRAGEQGAFEVTLINRGASKPTAALSVTGLPDGATAAFTVPALAAGHSTALTVAIPKSMPNGTYPLLVTASPSGGGSTIRRSASVAVEVSGGPIEATPVVCGGADLSGVNSSISVSTLGQDGPGCGISWATACATISQGIANCNVPCAVLVRHGRYKSKPNETIALRDGVSVYGGCSLNEPPNDFRTVIEANPAPGAPAISATNINSPTLVYGIVVVGKNETANGTASIAMSATNSKGLTLTHSVLAAGRGGDGASGGIEGAAQPGGGGGQGNAVSGAAGGGFGPNCPSNRVGTAGDGGRGGDGLIGELGSPYFCVFTCPCGYPNGSAAEGKAGNASGASEGGAGGAPFSGGGLFCTDHDEGSDFDGKPGKFGNAGACGTLGGTPSRSIFGSASGARWIPSGGGQGGPGTVGAGGGGGNSGGYCVGFPDGVHPVFINGYPGSGGGGGGCGGIGGPGGQQGGASIALTLVNSTVAGVPAQNSIVPGPGGTGGSGGTGGPGGAGGPGGPAIPAGPTVVAGYGYSQLCPAISGVGGPGGQGGAGSGGAGGNGGPSIGIALVSGSPNPGGTGIYTGLPGGPGGFGPGGQNAAQPVVQPSPCKAADGSGGLGGGTGAVINMDNPPSATSAGSESATESTRVSAACPPACANQTISAPVNFSHQSLAGADFTGATIIGVPFIGADLTGAHFDNAKFQGVPGSPTQTPDFTFANLTHATFTNALYQAPTYFTWSTLTCADFSHGSVNRDDPNGHAVFGDELTYEVRQDCRVKFRDVTMSCDFIGDWKNFDMADARVQSCRKEFSGKDFSGAMFSGVNFSGDSLDGSLFLGADLTFTNLDNTSLQCLDQPVTPNKPASRCVDMTGAQLQGAHINNANLSGASLEHATLSDVTQDGRYTNSATLVQSHLRNVNLSNAQLSGVDFTLANFYGTIVANPDGCNTASGDYKGFTGTCASAHKATMTDTKFNNAYLFGVDFSDAALSSVDFSQAVVVGAHFSGTEVTTNPNGGAATSYFRAYMQGTNLDLFDKKFSLLADLSNAFYDFLAGGNTVIVNLSSDHNQFAACLGGPRICRVPTGQGVCVTISYPTSTVPENNPSITCPNGTPGSPNGCGTDLSSARSAWKSNLTILNPPQNSGLPKGWYRKDATFEPSSPEQSFCDGKFPILDW